MCNRHYIRWYRYGDPHFRKKNANGEGTITTQGYRGRQIAGRFMTEHRRVMESILGRRLLRTEIIHHLDGDKLNNTPSNLMLADRRTHMRFHPEHAESWQKKGNPARWKKGTTFSNPESSARA